MADEFEVLDMKLDSDPLPLESPRKAARTNSRTQKSTPSKPNSGPRTPNRTDTKKEIQALIALMAMPVAMRDPICGGAVIEQSNAVAEALTDIAMQNEKLMKLLTSGGDVMMYLKLAMALSPIAQTVYGHHFVRHEEEITDEFGTRFVA
jgi:hypothetical protein